MLKFILMKNLHFEDNLIYSLSFETLYDLTVIDYFTIFAYIF